MYFQSLVIIKQVEDRASFKKEAYDLVHESTALQSDQNLELIVDLKESKASIGVEDVEEITSWNSLRSDSPRVCFIFNANFLTSMAQNALLKVIEEPNKFSQIILVTDNKSALLDTILSRCKVVEFSKDKKEKQIEIENFFKSDYFVKKKTVNDLAQNRLAFINFIENLLNFTLIETIENPEWNRGGNMIEWVEKWQLALKSSVSTKLVATSVLLHLAKYE